MFIPSHTRQKRKLKKQWCYWCCKQHPQKDMFKIRDGPVDWFFCDLSHADLWLEHRYTSYGYKLCTMLPSERRTCMNGSMQDTISRLQARR